MGVNGRRGVAEEDDDEERHQNPFFPNASGNRSTPSKLQFRKEVSRARWAEELGMAEIAEQRGSIWSTTGIVRNGKLYCHIEEVAFLAERGALSLSSCDDNILNVQDIYEKVNNGKVGCSWESFVAYRHLKLLGYIVQRHGIPWTMKGDKSSSLSLVKNDQSIGEVEELIPILLKKVQIKELKPEFDIYLPNSKFKKSAPGDPCFRLCLCSGDNPPSRSELKALEKQYTRIPLRFCFVDHGRVSFFSFDRVSLPTLP